MTLKPSRILYVYKWATMGGVERVFLNRAHAFLEEDRPLYQDIFFLHDSGGKDHLRNYINEAGLSRIRVLDTVNFASYDAILSVDTPEILEICPKPLHNRISFECHSGYPEGRTYLKKIPNSIRSILFPSAHFLRLVLPEIPSSLHEKCHILRNSIPVPMLDEANSPQNFLTKRPIFYIGRIDEHKNVLESLAIFEQIRTTFGDEYVFVVSGPDLLDGKLQKEVKKRGLSHRFISLPPIPFSKTANFFSLMAANNGIFISSSKAESFGLSAGEALRSHCSVLLSDAYTELLGDDTLTYELGNIEDAIKTFSWIRSHEKENNEKITYLQSLFSHEEFIKNWDDLKLF